MDRMAYFKRTGFVSGRIPNKTATIDSGSPILIVVTSVLVRKKCLFVDTKGYSDNGVTWTLDSFEIDGDTSQFNGPWDKLDDYIINQRFVADDGKIYRIQATVVDMALNTLYVCEYLKRYSYGVFGGKGKDHLPNGETYRFFHPDALDIIGTDKIFHINMGKLKNQIIAIENSFWRIGIYQPPWCPNFPEDFRWEKDSRTINAYAFNLAVLELIAEYWCKEHLNLPSLDWQAFWDAAKKGEFYTDNRPAA